MSGNSSNSWLPTDIACASTTIHLPGSFERKYAGSLEIQLGPEIVRRYHLEGEIRLEVGPQRLQSWYRFYGHNVHLFCDELEQLHRTLKGSAKLYNWDGMKLMRFSAADGRGTIAAGGWFNLPELGTELCVDGFLLDQSDLPRAISSMRRFLSENDIVTDNPDLPEFDWTRVRASGS